ncbi:ATP-binding protein [Streptomyces liangshanensis]|uniref:DNA topoisomerase (ATP-hydrolyzing) n=1 Tax=Streptomyces liangshanensis TaxID=2717324 RepID=A0A6G9GU92_9ACTN|nr:ATP-binding protein [Streptomyces liangshanensis]QIQ01629.1 ATP-binding protein [Streptomyces liangshanensis]
MDRPTAPWRNTTHDWTSTVDAPHLTRIRDDRPTFAPGGTRHLILEVVAYAADEAEARGAGACVITLHADGSVSITDNGRGTDTRADDHGRAVKKPVMASKDLRFFDHPEAQSLPDGHPRRGMSVVAALSEWLVHTNRRAEGAWTQRYESGIPTTDLTPIAADGTTGTTVHFRPDDPVRAVARPLVDELSQLVTPWPHLSVEIADRRGGSPAV